MGNQIILSIVMTTYNASTIVVETIQSILTQSFKNFELLITDDGSTDNTVELIRNFNDKRIKIYKRKHYGRANALNYTLKKTIGKYIAINDADDIPLENKFKIQVDFLEKNPHIWMVGTQGYILYKGKNKKIEFNKPLEYEQIKKHLLLENPFIHSSVMFRREIFEQGIYYDEKFTDFGIEYELWSRLLLKFKAVNLPDRLIIYKVHDSNTFRKRNPFIKFKHQIVMRYLVYKRLKYKWYYFFLIFYNPIIFLFKDIILQMMKKEKV